MTDEQLRETIHALPKIELHRHLEGAVRLETLIDVSQQYEITLPDFELENLRRHVQVMPGEPRDWQHFLSKFSVLRHFFRSEEVIKRVTHEVIADAAADNIKYLELRFTPQALNNVIDCSFEMILDWVCEATGEAAAEHDIEVRLIVSLNRHESVRIGEQVLKAARQGRSMGIVGLDLAGQEPLFSSRPFRALFEQARADGFGITIHAGEWDGPNSIRDALAFFDPERIGHGVRAFEDPALVEILVERETALEICPTSNVQSGVVDDMSSHPLPSLFRKQVRTTINTDDPLVCNITLSDEYYHLVSETSLSLDDLKQNILTAARVVFLPPDERDQLVARFEDWLS